MVSDCQQAFLRLLSRSFTLLENVISTMDELSYVYDEETVKLYIKLLLKRCLPKCLIAQFNEDLDKHRKDISDSSSGLIYLYCNAHFLLGLSHKCDLSHKCESVLLEFEKNFDAELLRPLERTLTQNVKTGIHQNHILQDMSELLLMF